MKKQCLAALAASAALALALTGCSNGERSDLPASTAASSSVSASSQQIEPVRKKLPINEKCLIGGPGFTKMEVIKVENYEDGTYWYEDCTEDGLSHIVNRSFPTDDSWKEGDIYRFDIEECIIRKCMDHGDYKRSPYKIQLYEIGPDLDLKDADYTTYVSWRTGYNEDTWEYVGVFAVNEDYTYVKYFGGPIDHFVNVKDVFLEDLNRVELRKP